MNPHISFDAFWSSEPSADQNRERCRIFLHHTTFALAEALCQLSKQAPGVVSVRWIWARDEATPPNRWPRQKFTGEDVDHVQPAGGAAPMLTRAENNTWVWSLPLGEDAAAYAQMVLVTTNEFDEKAWEMQKNNSFWAMSGAYFFSLIEKESLQEAIDHYHYSDGRRKILLHISQLAHTSSGVKIFLDQLKPVLSCEFNLDTMRWTETVGCTPKSIAWTGSKFDDFQWDEKAWALSPEAKVYSTHQMQWKINQGQLEGDQTMSFPVITDGFCRGVLTVKRSGRGFNSQEKDLVEFAASELAIAAVRWRNEELLDATVEQRTKQLRQAYNVLHGEVEERRRSELLKSCLFELASEVVHVQEWEHFYKRSHDILNRLMSARNFYVALVNEEGDWLTFPYFADEMVEDQADREVRYGLTEYVLRTGLPMRASSQDADALQERGLITRMEPKSQFWMGAPLIDKGNVFGVVAVQSYRDDETYSERDLEVLVFVAQQMSSGILRNRALADLYEANMLLEHRVAERTESLSVEIVERKKIEEQLNHESLHDSLTGLPNRKFLRERLALAISSHKTNALLFIDIDRFKGINDTLGHAVGDEVLKEVAHRMYDNLRSCEMVARLSGDEFVVLICNPGSEEDVEKVTHRLLDCLKDPVVANGHVVAVSCSGGWCMTYADHPLSADELLRNADLALYRAKRKGRQRVERFVPEDHQQTLAALGLEGELLKAVAEREFYPVFQAVVDMRNDDIMGYEALVRWRHPERGELHPVDFLPIVERNGLIEQIDWDIYEQSLLWAVKNLNGGQYMSLNVSARHFKEGIFASRLVELTEKCGWKTSNIRLELNERTLFETNSETFSVMTELKQAGFHLALDDFGTGFSSLSYLHRFPINSIKIDQSFVSSMKSDGLDTCGQIIQAILAMASALHIDVVAEGVERPEIQKTLVEMGCHWGQGFLFPALDLQGSSVVQTDPYAIKSDD